MSVNKESTMRVMIVLICLALAGCGGGAYSEAPPATGAQVPAEYTQFVAEIRPTIEAKVGALPQVTLIAATAWYCSWSAAGEYTLYCIPGEAEYKTMLCHELAHACVRRDQESWVAEVIAEASSALCGYPRHESMSVSQAEKMTLETDYSFRVRLSFAVFLMQAYGEDVIRRIVASQKVGREAVSDGTGEEWGIIQEGWLKQ
jgi:Tfp pilus assembly protein PilP